MESFPRKLVVQSLFVHTGSVLIVVRIVPAMQFVLHGDITLPLYKWRLDKCLHFLKSAKKSEERGLQE